MARDSLSGMAIYNRTWLVYFFRHSPPGEGNTVTKSNGSFMDYVGSNEKSPGSSDPREPAGGSMVPGSPRSGLSAESCAGPNPVEGLPAGSRPVRATAEESDDQIVRSIADRYLGPDVSGALQSVGATMNNDDSMSVTGLTSTTPRNKRFRDRESLSNSNVDGLPVKGCKVLRLRIIGTDSDDDNAGGTMILSDSPKEVAAKVRGKKVRSRKLNKLDRLDDSFESTR